MGNSASDARDKAADNADTSLTDIQNMIAILEGKVNEFIARTRLERAGEGSLTEVSGGRTISRMSQIRVSTKTSIDSQLTNAIGDFFEAAQGGDAGKQAAVTGAKNLVIGGLNALFGSTEGQGMEKTGFVVLFLNFAFVRVDYFAYSYNVSGKAWGAESASAGACYVCDLAVLDPSTDLKNSEIDYLISQSLNVQPGPPSASGPQTVFEMIMELKILLTESAILSRLLDKPDLSFDDLGEATDGLSKINDKIKVVFKALPTFEKVDETPSGLGSDNVLPTFKKVDETPGGGGSDSVLPQQ